MEIGNVFSSAPTFPQLIFLQAFVYTFYTIYVIGYLRQGGGERKKKQTKNYFRFAHGVAIKSMERIATILN